MNTALLARLHQPDQQLRRLRDLHDDLAHLDGATAGDTTVDGMHRACTAEQTWHRIRPTLARFGITRVADITGLDRLGIPVAVALQPRSRSLVSSQGKGLTAAAAKTGAALEAIEAWCAADHRVPVFRARLGEARQWPSVCDFERLAGFDADGQTHPVGSDRKVRWTVGLNLIDRQPRVIPYESVHLDFRVPIDAGDGLWSCSSVGLAAGNTLAEAVLSALCEVLEHHQDDVWRDLDISTRRLTRIDLGSLTGPAAQLAHHLERHGVRCALWEQTAAGCATPAVFAGIVETDPHRDFHTLPLATGNGCHLDVHVATYRALIEAVQSRAGYISGSRDDVFDEQYEHIFAPSQLQSALDETDLPSHVVLPTGNTPESTAGQLRTLLNRLTDHGWDEVVAVDLTPPDAPVHIARVVVPGARRADR